MRIRIFWKIGRFDVGILFSCCGAPSANFDTELRGQKLAGEYFNLKSKKFLKSQFDANLRMKKAGQKR